MDKSVADRKEKVKEIILALHKGLPVQKAKERFETEVGDISATEIAQIEQELLTEGMSVDEVKKLCNVHALLFEKSLKEKMTGEEATSHPVHLFKLENREIEKITASLKDAAAIKDRGAVGGLLEKLRPIEVHYTKKEQLLFPFLEKVGFMGPSKVMWGKHNDIRAMFKDALLTVERAEDFDRYREKTLDPLIEEVDGMIFKEEQILFPAAIEKLKPDDWLEILKQGSELGYAFIEGPKEIEALMKELRANLSAQSGAEDGYVDFPTGRVSIDELMIILNTLPVDISFVGADNRVKYFSESSERIFVRTKAVIGREIKNCHPPQSVDRVMTVVEELRSGKSKSVDFWLNIKDRMIYIRYFGIFDGDRNYLGTLEVTQDITDIRNLAGEKRLP
ncbi:MAG: DUF438 domain-containing protein [Deltaproteobacteria bacterium]|nr:DUF438 domain-containing protein [Deltaproteobacteria bacterium]